MLWLQCLKMESFSVWALCIGNIRYIRFKKTDIFEENFLEIASFFNVFNVLNSPRKSAFIGSG